MMQDTEQSLKLLGYDRRWLVYGFLSLEELACQHETFESSDDQNAEHYRYASFLRILDRHLFLANEELAQYIELAVLDPDQAMAGAALANLLTGHRLSQDQVEHIATHSAFQSDGHQRLVRRRRLTLAIETGPISDELVKRCLASKDRMVQESLIVAKEITRQQLDRLVHEGCNSAVRNRARQQQSISDAEL
ncbi:hypothetical protein [Acaryochloris marina]|uniref:Uncharacterized protein n=1 Tax=Acaryochloris marina (strain MBIC 11017) TaxID=329726 RepID=B0CFI9_ACAM1|nr:hypothetical protein [Acaryochloris marina]ABW27008.1 hypothetical protein AM1_1991 [Acaryochloris marina MBIC11017]BDM81774.1 hypothetical protein AM10699_46410 [Acaryochloris marina MBIC10699]